uniref:Uncharacterized protein n=1 Tax=Arundo donax TaxID=35708 RepID=A0A0A9BCG8_ARUDO
MYDIKMQIRWNVPLIERDLLSFFVLYRERPAITEKVWPHCAGKFSLLTNFSCFC